MSDRWTITVVLLAGITASLFVAFLVTSPLGFLAAFVIGAAIGWPVGVLIAKAWFN